MGPKRSSLRPLPTTLQTKLEQHFSMELKSFRTLFMCILLTNPRYHGRLKVRGNSRRNKSIAEEITLLLKVATATLRCAPKRESRAAARTGRPADPVTGFWLGVDFLDVSRRSESTSGSHSFVGTISISHSIMESLYPMLI